MAGSFPSSTAPLIAQAGALGYITMHCASLLVGPRRREPLPAWVLGWCLAALAFILARLVQRTADVDAVALAAGRLQYAAAAVACISGVGVVRAFVGPPLTQLGTHRLMTAAVTAALVIYLTPIALSDQVGVRVDALGTRYLAAKASPTVVLIAAGYVVALLFVVQTLTRSMPPRAVRALRICTVMFAFFAANDLLQSAGIIHSVHLFEYGICGFTLFGVYFLMRKMDVRFDDLESAVATRTGELAAQGQSLARALDDVRAAESRYRQLSDASLEGVLVHEGSIVVDSNRAAEAMFGARDTLIGRPVAELFVAAGPELIAALDGDFPGPIEVVALQPDGEGLPVEVMSRRNAWRSSDGVVIVVHDIREKKRAQARLMLADRMASLSTVAAGMAHEINNPLAFVMLDLEFVAEQLADAQASHTTSTDVDVRALVTEAHDGCARIQRIVANMKALSRADADEPHAVDLEKVLDAAVRLADNQVRHRAKLVRTGVPAQRVLGSDTGLTQVFLNLLVNAAQSIPEGHAAENQVELAVSEDAEGVVVEVRDSGRGVPVENIPHIFDPFFTTKQGVGGTGLGLSICHGIVASVGGAITVERRARGTTFHVRLRAATAMHQRSSLVEVRVEKTRRGRILIVDDEPAVGVALGRALRGHETVTASTGHEAIERCRRERFDLVLCDLMMPEMSGMEFFAKLREFDPATAARAVFISGGAFTENAREFLAAVPNPRLEKPFDVFVLQELVQELLARQQRSSSPVGAQSGPV